jgi:hypothetical protein
MYATTSNNGSLEDGEMNAKNCFWRASLVLCVTTFLLLSQALSTRLTALNAVTADEQKKAPDGNRPIDPDMISKAAGTKATTTPDGVVRIGWARTDVAVKVDGTELKPFAGLGSWAAFTSSPHGAMVMGPGQAGRRGQGGVGRHQEGEERASPARDTFRR